MQLGSPVIEKPSLKIGRKTTKQAPLWNRGCQFQPSQFGGLVICITLEEDLIFELDLLTRFDVDEAPRFIIGRCCAFSGG